MNHLIKAGPRSGTVSVPASKSQAHRLLICAALGKDNCTLICDGISKDISATINCLNALGADIKRVDGDKLTIRPVERRNRNVKHLYCGESGSTLRFLIPVVGALDEKVVFHMEGKLPNRPLGGLIDAITSHGMTVRQQDDELICFGKLTAGDFCIPGDISSQFVSGLLFSLPLLNGDSSLKVTEPIESEAYISMTEDSLRYSGIRIEKNGNLYSIHGHQQFSLPKISSVEQDWSNAAFFLCMGALSADGVSIKEMPVSTRQGDAEILNVLLAFGSDVTIDKSRITARKKDLIARQVDARHIPDLVPTICALASGAKGTTTIINAGRLRFKESDRLKTTAAMLKSLGADIQETQDGLIIKGRPYLAGGTVDASNDHRIAMAAAVAAGFCKDDVTVIGAECVEKSFPDFWNVFESLEVNE